jgi:hypothetical protein
LYCSAIWHKGAQTIKSLRLGVAICEGDVLAGGCHVVIEIEELKKLCTLRLSCFIQGILLHERPEHRERNRIPKMGIPQKINPGKNGTLFEKRPSTHQLSPATHHKFHQRKTTFCRSFRSARRPEILKPGLNQSHNNK